MCGQKAAIRRRKQAAKNYAHMAPMDRPHYTKMSAAKSARRLAKKIATERRMQQGKKKGK
jgi:hypothetical protein